MSGPSGVGKDTVLNEWMRHNPRVQKVVAYTTRAARPGEVEGVDYHFASYDEFIIRAEAGDFLEYKEVHGNYYATPLSDMEAILAEGKAAVLKIDVKGAMTAMELRSNAITVFLLPPNADELERRIKERGLDDPKVILQRLYNAREELALAVNYEHRIVNEEVHATVAELDRIVSEAME